MSFSPSIEVMIWQQSQLLQYAYVCCQTTLLGLQKYNNKTKQQWLLATFTVNFL